MTDKSNLIIKVCGMRDADNIRAVDSLAAVDWMGFIFYPPSPRFVSHRPAAMPSHCKRVGVFVDATTEEIINHQAIYSLDIIQLHGHETADYCRQLRSALPKCTSIIKTVQVSSPEDLLQTAPFEGLTDFFLFETRCAGYGGSGQQFDWDMLHHYQGATPFILSGGIGPGDTAKVHAFSHPMFAGIDLNSKFEIVPAVKDIQTLSSFILTLNTMNRINTLFNTQSNNILSIYFCAGHPTLEGTADTIKTLQQKGVKMIEIGIPFSDPMADGPVIQDAATKALRNGMTLRLLFRQLRDIRQDVTIPLILMGYLNPIMQFGFETFCRQCVATGIDGVIIPDLPFKDYLEEYKPIADKYDVRIIMLITPETSDERIRFIDDNTDGFIYMVSSAATTGAQKEFDDTKQRYFSRINGMQLHHPRMIGFGISNKQTLDSANANASGAIIGSKFVTLLEETGNAATAMDKLYDALKQ